MIPAEMAGDERQTWHLTIRRIVASDPPWYKVTIGGGGGDDRELRERRYSNRHDIECLMDAAPAGAIFHEPGQNIRRYDDLARNGVLDDGSPVAVTVGATRAELLNWLRGT